MIATLGLMFGGYMIFRFIEIGSRSEGHFASARAQNLIRALALAGVLATGFFMGNLIRGGPFGLTIQTSERQPSPVSSEENPRSAPCTRAQ